MAQHAVVLSENWERQVLPLLTQTDRISPSLESSKLDSWLKHFKQENILYCFYFKDEFYSFKSKATVSWKFMRPKNAYN